MRRAMVVLAVAVACRPAASARQQATPMQLTSGVYAFQLSVDGNYAKGVILLTPDTATIDPGDAICRPIVTLPWSSPVRPASWSCTGMALEPILLGVNRMVAPPTAGWSRIREQTKQRRVCLTWRTDTATGQQICVEYGFEPYQVPVTDGGIVHLTPIAARAPSPP